MRRIPGRLLRVAEVAALLSVSRATVYTLVEKGVLPHVRVCNAIRVRPRDVEAYIVGGGNPAPPPANPTELK